MGKFLGEYNRLGEIGVSNAMACPQCRNEVKFHISKSSSSVKILYLPFGEYSVNYFALCPECAGAFKIDNDLGAQLEKEITDFELRADMLINPGKSV